MVLGHVIGGGADLPAPVGYFLVGAGVLLIVSYVALAILWREPRLQGGPGYRMAGGPGRWGWLVGGFGVVALLLVVGQLLLPLLGLERDLTRPTIAPVTVWVLFWLVVPFLASLVGNWYADLNPWRALARVSRLGSVERPHLVDHLGVWPAAVLLFSFAGLELVSPSAGSPTTLGVAALSYTLFLLVVMVVVGRESGLMAFDIFTTYNRLFSAISPVGRTGSGRLVWRGWLKALPVLPEWPGLAGFVVAMIGTVTYDGAVGTVWFANLSEGLGHTMVGELVLMALTVGAVGLAYLGASAMTARFAGGGHTTRTVARRFAHTLVPVAVAYAFAHYFTLILVEGQQVLAAASDPFGIGWDLFGTAGRTTTFLVTSPDPVWYTQVTSIVGGHVLGVVLAHDRALADFGGAAVRSRFVMLLLMILFACLGLLVLAG